MVFNPDGTVVYAYYAPVRILALALGSSGEVYTTDGLSVTKMELGATATSLAYLVNAASFDIPAAMKWGAGT